nr:hypothetical protein [Pandoravirus massiliensis]
MQAVGSTRLWAAAAMAAACAACLWMAYGASLASAYGLLAIGWIAAANCRSQKSVSPLYARDQTRMVEPAHSATSPAFTNTNGQKSTAADGEEKSPPCQPCTGPLCNTPSANGVPGHAFPSYAESTIEPPCCMQKKGCASVDEPQPEPGTESALSTNLDLVRIIDSVPQSALATLHGRPFVVTHAAHSTGRHEATYLLAGPCAVGMCDVVSSALSRPAHTGPEMVLLEADGFITVFWRHGRVPMMATREPLAAGDRVTITLDMDAASVHFSINGARIAPLVPLSPDGTYAFVTDDRATASTLAMIADRRLRSPSQE